VKPVEGVEVVPVQVTTCSPAFDGTAIGDETENPVVEVT
jgi:hypothetical protein